MDTEELLGLLRSCVKARLAGSQVAAVAYSGGLDSAVIEALAREAARTVCYTCAVPGSHDHARAPTSAAESGIELHMLELDREALEALVVKTAKALGTTDPLRIAYTIPILGVVHGCEEEVILTGSGADELFGGYAKYTEESDPGAMMERDLQKMLVESRSISDYGRSSGKRVEIPFAAPELVSFSRRLAIDRKLVRGERKVILREVAKSIGVLSHDIPKKAAQYSSGVMKELRKMAKEQGKGLGEWVEETVAKGRRMP